MYKQVEQICGYHCVVWDQAGQISMRIGLTGRHESMIDFYSNRIGQLKKKMNDKTRMSCNLKYYLDHHFEQTLINGNILPTEMQVH